MKTYLYTDAMDGDICKIPECFRAVHFHSAFPFRDVSRDIFYEFIKEMLCRPYRGRFFFIRTIF